ncbi:DUF1697 domain-containing protein [Lachnospiraceae bacterium ZAX-1]
MKQVSSVLSSGSIIFQSDTDKSKLCNILESTMDKRFQMETKLFVKDISEIKSLLDAKPFTDAPNWHIYTIICAPKFVKVLVDEFKSAVYGAKTDEGAAHDEMHFFWHVRKGETLNTPFSKILGNRKFKEKFTSRNINTIQKVYNKMG